MAENRFLSTQNKNKNFLENQAKKKAKTKKYNNKDWNKIYFNDFVVLLIIYVTYIKF